MSEQFQRLMVDNGVDRLARDRGSGSIPGAAAQAALQELIDAFATASRRTPDGTRAMKDRSPALLFRSEIEQERAPWVDLTRWRRRRE
jgi:hypothetical protein